MYLRCVSHEPYISSDEVGHNLSFLPEIRTAIKERDKRVSHLNGLIEISDFYPDGVSHINWFLRAHPKCELEIWDEYGKQYDLEGEDEEPMPTPYEDLVERLETWCAHQDALSKGESMTTAAIREIVRKVGT